MAEIEQVRASFTETIVVPVADPDWSGVDRALEHLRAALGMISVPSVSHQSDQRAEAHQSGRGAGR